MASAWKKTDEMTQRLCELGFDIVRADNTLVALGMIADLEPEVLWLDSLDNELTLEEILDALRIPRRIHPLAVVISSTLASEHPNLNLSPSDEVVDFDSFLDNSTLLLQTIKVTRLERQINQREHEILNSLPHALLVVDRSLTLWKVNRQVEQLLEITDRDYRKKALGRHFGDGLTAAGLALEGDPALPRLVAELEQAVRNNNGRFRVKECIGGSERLISGEITQLVESPEHFLIDLRDITADEQAVLVEARRERLATIGNLSVGVAHEIQNPNTFSRVSAANLKMMFEAVKPAITQSALASGGKLGNMPAEVFIQKTSEAIAAVDMASRRIEAVLTTLKAFGRNDDGQLQAVSVKPIVDEAVMLIKHETRGKCEVIVDVSEDLPPVTASATGLSQILVNLLQNAVHAFAEDKPQRRGSGAAEIRILAELLSPEAVVLAVEDNGPGIPKQLQEKIFRPYFSTKPQGQGTGLGLSISTDMLHRFGGELTLHSQPGEGTTFYIKLRRHEQPPDHS